MGDISSGLAYLCGICCCVKEADVSADGSGFRSRTKVDPRELQIDQEFLSRNYKRDASGRFIIQSAPQRDMPVHPQRVNDQPKETTANEELETENTKLQHADSEASAISHIMDANGNPEILVPPHTG